MPFSATPAYSMKGPAGPPGANLGGGEPPLWTRPSNWLPTTVTAGEQKIQILMAVSTDTASDIQRGAALFFNGNHTIDWGDGTAPENYNAGIVSYHTYNPAVLTDLRTGWKQVLITVTPQSGQTLTSVSLDNSFYQATGKSQRATFLELVTGPSTLGNITASGSQQAMLEHIDVLGNPVLASMNIAAVQTLKAFTGSFQWSSTSMATMFGTCTQLCIYPTITPTVQVTTFNNMFLSNYKMVTPPVLDMSNATGSCASMFSGCYNLKEVPSWVNLSKTIAVNSMFTDCRSIQSATVTLSTACTTMASMFSACLSLREITINGSTAAVTTLSSTFSGCPVLERISGTLNCTACTSVSMFSGNYCLKYLTYGPGPKQTFSLQNTVFDAATLDAIYTSLPTVTAQTITVSFVPGTLGDNPAIATAKGWTVTGS